MRDKREVVGDVAREIRVSLFPPPIDPTYVRRYFGNLKRFGAVDKQVATVTGGVPVNDAAMCVDLARELRYSNHRSATEHLSAMEEDRGGRKT